ncbi:SusC/RagA family TonB-linked outer membrane protein [Pedobacter panaciterrae]|uniref:SusC/RagA family TonB-linked outer membrane protein n=1 Tax=Pedobacter panaciterrae TaxID=363849 RepID=A0ABU8NHF3_9SPHI
MKKTILFIVLAMLCHFLNVKAQVQATIISGVVSDEKGAPIPGCTIKFKGETTKALTDAYGHFSIASTKHTGTIQVSSVGYKLTEIQFTQQNKGRFKVILTRQENQLKDVEIVSTGYQNIPKERATGSFTTIDNKTLNRAVSSDILSRLKGITNGLLFDNSTGNSTGISVRGRSTIFSNTTPLIVVDNFPFEGDLNTLNPDVIENITVLKDAAAASIWGVRAGNGVIVITTKKGSLNTSPKIGINANLTIGEKPDLYYQPQLSSSQYIDVEKFLFDKGAYDAKINNGYTAISPVVAILQKIKLDQTYAAQGSAEVDALRSIDNRSQWSKYFFRNSSVQHYSADINGGGKNQTYFFSAGYDKNFSNSVALSDDRITLKANNNYNLINDRLKLNTDITFSKSKSNNTNTFGYSPFVPYEQVADEKGNPLIISQPYTLRDTYTDTAGNGRLLDWKYRPLDELRNEGSTQITYLTDYRLNLGLSYKIIKPLSFSLNYQYYNANTKSESNYDRDSYYARDMVNTFSSINSATGVVTRPIPYGDIYNPNFASRQSDYGRVQLDFNQVLAGKHEVSAIAGYEIRNDGYKQNSYNVYGYSPGTETNSIVDYINFYNYYYNPSISARIPELTRQGKTVNRYISLYGNASYIYSGRYILSGSYRKDESNLFGVKANQKGVPLWSTGFAWNIHKESFFDINWLSSLQLKATYGYNGNVNNSISAYLTASPSFYNPYGVLSYAIINPPNDNLRWERVKNANFGLYFSTEKGWLSGSVEYYVKNGTDLIATSPIAPQTGISIFTGNTANTNTKGLDVQLNSKIFDHIFKWNTSFVFNYVRDKITDYKVAAGTNQVIVTARTNKLTPQVGYPINSVFAFKSGGLDAQGNPQGYVDNKLSIDYTTIRNSNDRTQLDFFGSATPTIFGSFRNTFSYKMVELSFNVAYKTGYYVRRTSLDYNTLFGASGFASYAQNDYDKRWQKAGDELFTNVPSMVYPNVSNRSDFYNYSSVLVERGDHIRLQDVQMNYSFSKKQFTKLPFSTINIYVYANNLGILWRANKQGLDPDVLSGYPIPRTIAFGIKATL